MEERAFHPDAIVAVRHHFSVNRAST
jgi:hypothetical protein